MTSLPPLPTDQPAPTDNAAGQTPVAGTAGTGGPVLPTAVPSEGGEITALEQAARSGGSWFYWIAGLSAANAIIVVAGGEWGFLFGLNITQVIGVIGEGLVEEGVSSARHVALIVSLVVAGVFGLFGFFATKAARWAFVLGGILFLLDGLLSLLVSDILGVIFHAIALFCLFKGFIAANRLARLRPPQPQWIDINMPPAL